MPEWSLLVRERLGSLDLAPAQQEEIVAELAGHCEDQYAELQRLGMGESEAIGRTLDEVADWHVFAHNIHRAKRGEEIMNSRTRTLWLPGLITLAASAIVLMIIGRVDIQPRVIWLRTDSLAFVFYVPWLVTLPLFGAAGAYLSRRAQGQFLARITAGLFPSAVMLAAMCLILPLGLIIDRHVLLSLKLSGFAVGLFNWVVVPGAALLLGALPFLGKPHVVGNR